MHAMIEHASYMAHGYCLLWQPWLVTLWAGSDLLIFLSYLAIPIALMLFLRRRPDLQHRGLVALFAAFILLCGLTHALSIVTLWYPIYPIVGVVKLATGLVSAATAFSLFRLIPTLVALPSPQKLTDVVGQLQTEAVEHRETMAALEAAHSELETKVEERTAELREANERMSLMAGEALHRARNLLGVVISLARQTASAAPTVEQFLETFVGRLDALSKATVAMNPGEKTSSVGLETILRNQLKPVLETYGERVNISGPELDIGTTAAQQIALAVHELATNAVKYGSLSIPGGTVDVTWNNGKGDDAALTFKWSERGMGEASPAKQGDAPGGFGTRLLMTAVPAMLRGEARRDHTESGMRYILTVPLVQMKPAEGLEKEKSRSPATLSGWEFGTAAG